MPFARPVSMRRRSCFGCNSVRTDRLDPLRPDSGSCPLGSRMCSRCELAGLRPLADCRPVAADWRWTGSCTAGTGRTVSRPRTANMANTARTASTGHFGRMANRPSTANMGNIASSGSIGSWVNLPTNSHNTTEHIGPVEWCRTLVCNRGPDILVLSGRESVSPSHRTATAFDRFPGRLWTRIW